MASATQVKSLGFKNLAFYSPSLQFDLLAIPKLTHLVRPNHLNYLVDPEKY